MLPQAAWEYCLYINSENDYGVYDKWYVKDQKPFQMQVNYIPSNFGKVHIKVPKSRIGNPSHVRFVIMTTKPDFVNPDSLANGTSTATDVCPGGMTAMTGGIIYSYASFAPPKPGTTITITTVKTTYYLYEGNQVLCELSPDGSVTSKHVMGLGKVIAKVDAFGKHFFTQDVLGSNRVVTDVYGQIERKTTYTPFGKVLVDEGNTNVSNYLFTGKEWDADEGLYYYGARYYDPDIGRFYAIDPLGSAAASPYMYCHNNPVSYNDPTGMARVPAYIPSFADLNRSFFASLGRGGSLRMGGFTAGFKQGGVTYSRDYGFGYYVSGLQDASGASFNTFGLSFSMAASNASMEMDAIWRDNFSTESVDLSGLENPYNTRVNMGPLPTPGGTVTTGPIVGNYYKYQQIVPATVMGSEHINGTRLMPGILPTVGLALAAKASIGAAGNLHDRMSIFFVEDLGIDLSGGSLDQQLASIAFTQMTKSVDRAIENWNWFINQDWKPQYYAPRNWNIP